MKYKFWLANIIGLSNSKKDILLGEYKSAKAIYYNYPLHDKELFGLTVDELDILKVARDSWNLDEEWGKYEETGMGFCTREDKDYPTRLRNIVNAPYALFYKGMLPDESMKSVAIVGARGRTSYGSSIARKLGERLALNNINVISGLARGIDGDAHAGALIGSGKTYAVLGCGADVIYPKEHRFLYEEIIENGGGIISEYPPKTPPCKGFFPQRNRIISGLSDAVCIVEARKRSGSLITADFAMEQGKDVYAVPGRITDELSEGCNSLISQGATPLLDLMDIIKDQAGQGKDLYIQMDFKKNLLEKDETLVYSLLDFQPEGLGNLLNKTNCDITQLIDILERLQNKGFIKEIVSGYYVRTL